MENNEIQDYIEHQKEEIQPVLVEVYQALKEALPLAVEKIAWRMPTFHQGHNIIHFAAFKNHFGIYPGPDAIVHFANRLSGYHTSKGAIQMPYDKPVDKALLQDIAKWCLDYRTTSDSGL